MTTFAQLTHDQRAHLTGSEEAGGVCSDMQGAKASLRGPHLLADNGIIHDAMVEFFAQVARGDAQYPMVGITGR